MENVFKFGMTPSDVVDIIEMAKKELQDESNPLSAVIDPNTIAFFEGVIVKKLVVIGTKEMVEHRFAVYEKENQSNIFEKSKSDLLKDSKLKELEIDKLVEIYVNQKIEIASIENDRTRIMELENSIKESENRIKELVEENDVINEELAKRSEFAINAVNKDESGELVAVDVKEVKILDNDDTNVAVGGEQIGK